MLNAHSSAVLLIPPSSPHPPGRRRLFDSPFVSCSVSLLVEHLWYEHCLVSFNHRWSSMSFALSDSSFVFFL